MELIRLLPDYYEGNDTMRLLQGILSAETDKLEGELGTSVSECFVVTASGLLRRYERIFGIAVDVGKSDQFRRERIMAKISGSGTTTRGMLADVASRYSKGEVEIIEDNANSRFVVKFVGTVGIPPNMEDLTLTINEVKPAHLAFGYEYVYNTHMDLKQHTYGELKAYTHWQLRNEVTHGN